MEGEKGREDLLYNTDHWDLLDASRVNNIHRNCGKRLRTTKPSFFCLLIFNNKGKLKMPVKLIKILYNKHALNVIHIRDRIMKV